MISSHVATLLARRNIHYGWVVAGVTFLTMLVTAGAVEHTVPALPGVKDVKIEHAGAVNADATAVAGLSTPTALRL